MLAVTYTALALVATAANLLAQEAVVTFWHGHAAILASMVAGTLVGLVTKYILDKRYIFMFTARSGYEDGRTFILYSLVGLFTTFIFWGFEIAFQYAFGSKELRYIGAAIGLAIGYAAKYQIDKRLVFPSASKRFVPPDGLGAGPSRSLHRVIRRGWSVGR
jgi:putative flippase GtrA